MSKCEYKCRDCGIVRDTTVNERDFGRVYCHACGGTCDPTEREAKRQAKVRSMIPSTSSHGPFGKTRVHF